RHRRRQADRARPSEDARGDARRARDVLRDARRSGADGDGGEDRRSARDRMVLQHPARRRRRDRGQSADLDDRLPGRSRPAVARDQARARGDLGRRADRAPAPRAALSGRASFFRPGGMGPLMDWNTLHDTLQAACDAPADDTIAELAVSAAELVVSAAGEPPDELPADARDWVETHGVPDDQLVELACRSMQCLAARSDAWHRPPLAL